MFLNYRVFKLWSSNEIAGGGGGNGEPLKRPVEKVLKDVRNGFVLLGRQKGLRGYD